MTPATPKLYEGTKRLTAQPMTRGEYNSYRGWENPAGEDPADAGYLVEYQDGGKANDSRHAGYISWSPADVFKRSYKPVDERQGKAPRVTPADIEASIVDVEIVKHVSVSGQVLRWAVLTARNGYAVVGRPSCAVSSENDDSETGVAIAIKNAKDELWPLLGFELKERLYQRIQPASAPDPA
jgi:hypothetical protein